MRRILLFLCLITSYALFAQLPKNLLTPTTKIHMFDEYHGSIYMKSRYKESSVIDEKSGTFDAKLKYNIYSDALEYNFQSKLYQVVKSPTIHARIDSDYFYYCEFKNQRGSNRYGYYILVELTDRYRIYKKMTLRIQDPEKEAYINSGSLEPGKLKAMTSYYIEESGIIMELPMVKKEILVAFKDKENELKDYLKKEKIRLRKEEDLIRLVAKYNALKSSDSNLSRSLLSNTERGN